MDPVTMAGIGIAATVIGGGVNAYGALREGGANRDMFNYKAGMAQLNQKLATQNADYTRKVGEVQAGQSGLKSRFQQGKIVTAQAASGLDVNTGTASKVQDSQRLIGQIDQGIIRSNAARRAYGYEVEAAKEGAESTMNIRAGENAIEASRIKAISSILGTASSVSSKWSDASRYGIFGPSSSGQVGPTEGGYYEG